MQALYDTSAALEQKPAEQIELKQVANWLADNQAAIANYNRHVDKHGVFSDDIRRF
ncbi:type II toxin-antitoxin system CcdA family antitoxin [Methylovulum psychrotolerans]|uniref:Plasmid maintenance protein CcdB n=1 Tax=Methylovulum psychrotolerans TaxID=1704499 RepID=A0A2S5CPS5_9GAMM|nr:type II toxin-antitoxin system CcdA family antitoxin [Methylovulum psychrotolerans]POZ52809.1 plasmid maintenance protein CcdB [Methylovulum psychrotolerans]